ncbi:helix-turn-helix domain-containing protein [Pelomonas saccharophila]|nr:helix-turn-helix domain-containing protein [Roseateles saccharophilus]
MVEAALERLGKRFWMARKLRGFTQQELADLADVSLSTLRALEAGADGVALGNALKVFQALDLLGQIDQLLDPQVDPQSVTFAERTLKVR